MKTKSKVKFTEPNSDIEVALSGQVPMVMVMVMGNNGDGKKKMITATLAVELNKLSKNVLFCYFDDSGHIQTKQTTTEPADLVIVVCPDISNNLSLKLFQSARLRILLIYDIPFGITDAYDALKKMIQIQQCDLEYESLVVNKPGSDDGAALCNNLTALASSNQLPCRLSYLGKLTLDEDIWHDTKLLEFADKTAIAHNSVAQQILQLLQNG